MNNLVMQNNDMQILQTIASTAHKSGLYNGVGGMEKIMMVLLAAHDLGIKPTIALNGGIWNIKGKIEISARLMTSMIRRAGHSLSIKESTDKVCTIKGKRCDNADEEEITFTIDQAKIAGLIRTNQDGSPGIWMKYPIDMLYARAMSRLARRLFPDVIGTAYVEGEIRDEPLQQAECEVSDCEPQNQEEIKHEEPKQLGNPVGLDCISESQIKEISSLVNKCDEGYLTKLHKHLLDKGYPSYAHIPKDMYNLIITGINKNIESQSKRKLGAN